MNIIQNEGRGEGFYGKEAQGEGLHYSQDQERVCSTGRSLAICFLRFGLGRIITNVVYLLARSGEFPSIWGV
mgnify:CR=1 FL=1|jgi:hypothetical protein